MILMTYIAMVQANYPFKCCIQQFHCFVRYVVACAVLFKPHVLEINFSNLNPEGAVYQLTVTNAVNGNRTTIPILEEESNSGS